MPTTGPGGTAGVSAGSPFEESPTAPRQRTRTRTEITPDGRVFDLVEEWSPYFGWQVKHRTQVSSGGGQSMRSLDAAISSPVSTARGTISSLEEELRLRDQYNREAEQRQFDRIQSLASPSQPRVSRTSGASAEQERASRAAAFARAKEEAGQLAASSMRALREAMAGSSMLGSGREGAGLRDIVSGAAENLGEVSRTQAIEDAAQAERLADLEYQGAIQQRAQDLGRSQSLMSLLTQIGGLY